MTVINGGERSDTAICACWPTGRGGRRIRVHSMARSSLIEAQGMGDHRSVVEGAVKMLGRSRWDGYKMRVKMVCMVGVLCRELGAGHLSAVMWFTAGV